jgi:hypothetical protein
VRRRRRCCLRHWRWHLHADARLGRPRWSIRHHALMLPLPLPLTLMPLPLLLPLLLF